MTQNEFDRRIQQLLSQIARLKAVRDGKLRMRTIKVRAHRVPAYWVGEHTRQITAGRAP